MTVWLISSGATWFAFLAGVAVGIGTRGVRARATVQAWPTTEVVNPALTSSAVRATTSAEPGTRAPSDR